MVRNGEKSVPLILDQIHAVYSVHGKRKAVVTMDLCHTVLSGDGILCKVHCVCFFQMKLIEG